MLESTPGSPYTGNLPDLLKVEEDMRYRYGLPPENPDLRCLSRHMKPPSREKIPKNQRDPNHNDVLPTSWCSRSLYRTLLQPRRSSV